MPIYEYQCRDCDHRLEKLQKLSDAPLTDCPECGHASLVKLVSAAGFRLKGGGWYETDFKKDGKRNLAGDDAGKPAAKSEGASEGKNAKSTGTGESKAEKPKPAQKPASPSASAAA
ncbi:MAG: zinc ribbon domain-containing protein [Wenzhouxiangellaceae bacterium]|nr:zinc ribbon domain-containing protein [Wenzhouxiangellaceae bacterium]